MSGRVLPEGWREVALGELVSESGGAIQTGPFGSALHAADYVQDGIPSVMPANIGDNVIVEAGIARISLEDHARLQSHHLRAGDIVYSRRGDVERRSLVREENDGWLCGTGCLRVRFGDVTSVNPSFVSYALGTEAARGWIVRHAVGATMLNLNTSILGRVPIQVPPVSAQCAIAEVLGALDDKIAAGSDLIQRCDNLSSVRFRMSLRGVDGQTIPLSELARFVNGGAYTKGASGTGRVVVRIAELNSGIGGSTVYSDREVGIDQTATPGDLLFAWSGSLTVHRWYRDTAIINQHIFKVIPDKGSPMWLVDQALRAKLEDFRATAADKATTMGHIQRRHLDEPVQIPGPEAIANLDAAMSGLWSRALAAEQENLRLAATREALLPALMSGRLTVRDAERVVADAT